MFKEAFIGTVAGALGTVALNLSTYADMAIRGRASSSAPSKMIEILADKAGIALSPKGVSANDKDETAKNRESGLGALLGYVNGLGTGTIYGLIRSQSDGVSIPLAAIGVGLAAMAASDVPIITLGVSDPKTWAVSDWASDAIPHLIYGLITVIAYEALMSED